MGPASWRRGGRECRRFRRGRPGEDEIIISRKADADDSGRVAEQADGEKFFAAIAVGGDAGGIAAEVVDGGVEGDDEGGCTDTASFRSSCMR